MTCISQIMYHIRGSLGVGSRGAGNDNGSKVNRERQQESALKAAFAALDVTQFPALKEIAVYGIKWPTSEWECVNRVGFWGMSSVHCVGRSWESVYYLLLPSTIGI
ncbi:hypothetical protein B0H11DRAFT_1934259 [Mycena galericulata]|nr:hypothetical protein B0H11DRAFT_1934259 [Mycena galericulata]